MESKIKKGIVNVNMIYLKKGGYVHKGKEITENDINNFDKLVEKGQIKVDEKIDLSKLLKPELQAECKRLEIDFEEAHTKAELIAFIQEAEKEEE